MTTSKIISLFSATILLFLETSIQVDLNLADVSGPAFLKEPPNQVDFSNSTGAFIDCSATGQPAPSIKWVHANGAPVGDVPGLQRAMLNGTLVFFPFSADDYRQDLHATLYRCIASNSAGLIVSRDVKARAVVMQMYEVQVYNEFVIEGNTAVFKCHIPSFVSEYVKVVSWIRETGYNEVIPIHSGVDRAQIMPSGELHLRQAQKEDAAHSYRCKTRHRLTGEIRLSSTFGRLVISNPQGGVSPRITDTRASITVREGESAVVPCAAQGYPAPSYSWNWKGNRSQLEPLIPNDRLKVSEGTAQIVSARQTDKGMYVCVVSNSVGNQTAETTLIVLVPFSVHIQPREQVVNLGQPATFLCTITGHPVSSVVWYKDGSPLLDSGGRVQSDEMLRIHAVQKSHKGMYQCLVKNERESAQGTAELRLGDALPELVEAFQEKVVQPGNHVALRCAASGNPTPTIMWTLDDEVLPVRLLPFATQAPSGGPHGDQVGHLNVSDIRVEEGGDYSCIARNRLGQTAHSARINVHGPAGIRQMKKMTVVSGDNMVIKCRVTGYPVDSITWEKDGMLLPVNRRQRVYPNGTLVVDDVRRQSDGGRYICTVRSNKDLGVSREVDVLILIPPKITPFSFQDEDLYEGMRAQITCAVRQGDLPITIKWLRDEQPLVAADGTSARLFDAYTSSLSIEHVTSGHNGNYTCVAANAAAAVNFTAQLNVNVPPRWIVEPNDVSLVAGQSGIINCRANGFPLPSITWMKALGNQPQEYREVSDDNVHLRPLANGSLHIRNARESEQGQYLCQASNGVGGGLSKVVFLDIQVPVRFEIKMANVTSRRGENARLSCQANGDLPLSVSWKKDSFTVDSRLNNRFQVTETTNQNGLLSVMEVMQVDREDTGMYYCEGQNPLGRDTAQITLLVKEAPEPPRGITVVDVSSRGAELTWLSGHHGNSDIRRHIVQYRRTSDERDEFVNVTANGDMQSASLSGLRPFTKYTLRVLAENEVGRSAPSETISITTSEEAPGGAPRDIHIDVPEGQSLKITWKPLLPEVWFGDILGYNVGYRVHGSGEPFLFRAVDAGEDGSGKVILRSLRTFTNYDIIIQAYNRLGAGPPSEIVTARTSEDVPRVAPHDLQCTPLSSQSMHITWQPLLPENVNGVLLGYKVLFFHHENDTLDKDSKVTSTLDTILHGLEKYQNYSFQVLGFTRVGDGVGSEIVSCRTLEDVPDAPGNIKAVVTSGHVITLSWQPSSRPNGVVTKYTVYIRSVEGGKDNTTKHVVSANQLQFVAKGLKRNRSYEFWVTASTMVGEGQSTRMVAEVPDFKVPARIISFGKKMFVPWKSKVSLPCQAVGDPEPEVTWKFGDAIFEPTKSKYIQDSVGTLVIEEIKPENAGEYSCSVKNPNGEDKISYILVVQAPPTPPTIMVSATSYSSITLHWKDTSDGGSVIKSFVLHYKREYGEWETKLLDSALSTFVLDNLWCGTKYQMHMTATNALGTGDASETYTIRTKGSAPTMPPAEKLLQSFHNFVTLNLNTWDDGGCEILYFIVEYRAHGSATWGLVSNNIKPQRESFMLPDLQPDAAYSLRITAHNSAGSTVAAYEFRTLTTNQETMGTEGSSDPNGSFYYDLKLVVSVAVAVVGLLIIVLVYAICVALRKKKMAARHQHQDQYSVPDKSPDVKLIQNGGLKTGEIRNHDYATKHGFNYLFSDQGCPNLPTQNSRKDDISPYATYRLPESSKSTAMWHELPLKATSSLGLYPNVTDEDDEPNTNIMNVHKYIKAENQAHVDQNEQYTIDDHYSAHGQMETNVPDLLYHGDESSTSNGDSSPDENWGSMEGIERRLPTNGQHPLIDGDQQNDRNISEYLNRNIGTCLQYQRKPSAPRLDDGLLDGSKFNARNAYGVAEDEVNHRYNDRNFDSVRHPEDHTSSKSYVGEF